MTRKLNIGGTSPRDGWEILNAKPGEHVAHVCDAGDLSRFDDGTFDAIYASHVLEHFDYRNALGPALAEWHRVLAPGGTLYVSVPDLDVLAGLLLDRDRLSGNDRFIVMAMMFGEHVDQHDYHQAGLNREFLKSFLLNAGFVKIRRVTELGLFDDTSTLVFKGVAISLNMIAEKPAATPP